MQEEKKENEERGVIGYFENLSLHLAKESLPDCLKKFLSHDKLSYFSSIAPALEIFSSLKDETATSMMTYLELLKEKEDPSFKSIISNIPTEGILNVFALGKENTEAFFDIITDR
jgi:hypothetical protein